MTSMRPAPATARVTQGYYGGFSARISGSAYHGGTDFGCPVGTPIPAPDDGTVVFASWCWNLPGGPNDWAARWYQLKPSPGNTRVGGGIMTVIRNDQGSIWIKAHLSNNNMVRVGQRVRRGDVVGLSGNTGSSTGPHLHLGLVPRYPNWNNGGFGAINAEPWLTIPYRPNTGAKPPAGTGSGTGSSSAGAGSSVPAASLWIPGAQRSPQSGGVKLNTSRPPRITWHITSDVDPGRQQPSFDAVGSYLERARYCPHILWDPFTGRIRQWYPANVGGRALSACNEDGRVHLQVEVLFSQGAIRDGRRYDRLDQTPLKGFDTVLHWADGWGIPRTWPMGPTPKLHTSGRRDPTVWRSKAGHYGHSQVPGNNHTDPGIFPNITNRPRASTGDWFDMATRKDLEEVIDAKLKSTGKDMVGGQFRHHFTPGNRESKIVLDGMGWVVRGSVNHMLSPNTKEGKTTLGRIAQAVLSAVIPAKGVAKGDMTLSDSEGWNRNYRAISESQAKRIEAKLDALAVAVASESAGKHTVKEEA